MKKSFKSILVLLLICATVSVLMAFTNSLTAPIIEKNEQEKIAAALLEVMPDGGSFEALDISNYTLPATVSDVWSAENDGYIVKLVTTGYSSNMVVLCGISHDGKIVSTKLVSSTETPAIGGQAADELAPLLVGKDAAGVDGVDTVSGATKTTAAYRAAVKDALRAFETIENLKEGN